ncbi:MAG: hypothetical protein JNL60_18070 [Bacteroidia bacterium]|nr:hypothetical protein [Bacteroidia bacterium]
MTPFPDPLILKEVDIPEAVITLRSDNIIIVRYKPNTILDVELQLRMREIYKDLTNNRKMNFIFMADDGFSLTKEARENSEVIASTSPIKAYAIIVNNLAYRIIANFYYKINKPQVPYKSFSTVKEAINWLYTLDTLDKISSPKQLTF